MLSKVIKAFFEKKIIIENKNETNGFLKIRQLSLFFTA